MVHEFCLECCEFVVELRSLLTFSRILLLDLVRADDLGDEEDLVGVRDASFVAQEGVLHRSDLDSLLLKASLDLRALNRGKSLRDDGNQQIEKEDDVED